MRIEIRGRNVEVTDELREHVRKRFVRLDRQVSEHATLDVELREERNPSIRDDQVCEVRMTVKGTVLVSTESAPQMLQAIKKCSEDMRRQVKRHRELRRRRWESRRASTRMRDRPA
jgi:putative sigma-54 modulation protein